jgi:hypothetical protein
MAGATDHRHAKDVGKILLGALQDLKHFRTELDGTFRHGGTDAGPGAAAVDRYLGNPDASDARRRLRRTPLLLCPGDTREDTRGNSRRSLAVCALFGCWSKGKRSLLVED